MSEWLGDSVENAFVEISIFARDDERDILAALSCDVTHDPWESPKQLFHRHHANFHDGTLQIIQNASLEAHRIHEFAAHRMLGVICDQLIKRLLEHRFSNDQLADEV